MFAPNPRSRPAPSYPSPAMAYRPDEYYLHNVPNISNATPRTFHDDVDHRAQPFYPDPYYPPRSKSYDNRDALPPPLPYHQSYDRHHNSPPNIHMSAGPYRQSHPASHHYVDRPSSSLPPLKRPDLSNMVDGFGLPPSHNAYAGSSSIGSEPIGSAPTAPSNRSHMDTEFWQEASPTPPPEEFKGHDTDSQPPSDTSKPKKTRREKPKIALAADQPPTTQGKPRARVYVACIQWSVFLISSIRCSMCLPAISLLFSRTRKIRCDGAKPVCHNCGRRASGSGECVYDPIPKRRGPDKTPGARQRMARADGEASTRRRRRRDTSATDITSVSASSSGSTPSARDINSLQPITLAPPPGSGEHSSPYPSPSEPSYPPNSNSNYGRSYSGSPQGCGCHGMGQCPDLLEGVSALSEYRKPTGAVRNLIF
jgi:hypothetical protein